MRSVRCINKYNTVEKFTTTTSQKVIDDATILQEINNLLSRDYRQRTSSAKVNANKSLTNNNSISKNSSKFNQNNSKLHVDVVQVTPSNDSLSPLTQHELTSPIGIEMDSTVTETSNGKIRKPILVSNPSSSSSIRLSKYLAETGLCSRREAEKWVFDKRVCVSISNSDNKQIITSPSYLIDQSNSTTKVYLDNIELKINNYFKSFSSSSSSSIVLPKLYAVYKMRGELMTNNDALKKRPVIYDRLKLLLHDLKLIAPSNPSNNNNNNLSSSASIATMLRPVIHQEFNTEGLCLFSNNPTLARLLNKQKSLFVKTYRVKINGLINEEKLQGLKKGKQ